MGNVTEDNEFTFEYTLKSLDELIEMDDLDLTDFPLDDLVKQNSLLITEELEDDAAGQVSFGDTTGPEVKESKTGGNSMATTSAALIRDSATFDRQTLFVNFYFIIKTQ